MTSLLSRLQNYFIGQMLEREVNDVYRANIKLVYFIIAYVIGFLLCMQVIYLFTANTFQLLKGFGVIAIFIGALFYMRFANRIGEVAHLLIFVSLVNVVANFFLFQSLTFFNGMIIVVNVLIAFHILGRQVGFIYAMLHLVSGLVFLMAKAYGALPAEPSLTVTLYEEVLVYTLLLTLIVFIINYYNKAYEQAGRRLVSSIKELKHANQNAEVVNKMKASFLANMSHEIRTPINGILGINQVLQQEVDDVELKEYIAVQYQSGQRLLTTIDSILSISKFESEQPMFNPIELNIVDVVKEVFQGLEHMARNKNLSFEISVSEQEIQSYVDEMMLYQALNNLIGNAIKFTLRGGVSIRVEKPNEKEKVLIRVKDTGIGISHDFKERLFEPFEQESAGTNREFEGSGLGLSITKRYIEMMGGSLDYVSEKGVGSEFFVILPIIKLE